MKIENRKSKIENGNSWLPDMDLNHDKQIQSLLCYRYTIGQAGATGKLNAFPAQSSRQTAVSQGRKRIAHGFNRGLAVVFASSSAGAKEMCVLDARPLPRREGEAICVVHKLVRCGCNRRFAVIHSQAHAKTRDVRIASDRRMILPLLGERAGVRADVTSNFLPSRLTPHATDHA